MRFDENRVGDWALEITIVILTVLLIFGFVFHPIIGGIVLFLLLISLIMYFEVTTSKFWEWIRFQIENLRFFC